MIPEGNSMCKCAQVCRLYSNTSRSCRTRSSVSNSRLPSRAWNPQTPWSEDCQRTHTHTHMPTPQTQQRCSCKFGLLSSCQRLGSRARHHFHRCRRCALHTNMSCIRSPDKQALTISNKHRDTFAPKSDIRQSSPSLRLRERATAAASVKCMTSPPIIRHRSERQRLSPICSLLDAPEHKNQHSAPA